MKLRFLHRAYKARYRDQRLEIALAFALIKPGDTVVDAGANKGAYTFWLRKAVGLSGQVLAFEPQPELARYLEQVRQRFGWSNVRIREVALSDEPGIKRLNVPGEGTSPGASLESIPGPGASFDCQVETLDRELRGQAVSFLKIDVEGHELALFRGAEAILKKNQPSILFECEARHLANHRMEEVFEFLRARSYTGFLLAGERLIPVSEFRLEVHQKSDGPRFWDRADYFNNFLFCPAGTMPERLAVFR